VDIRDASAEAEGDLPPYEAPPDGQGQSESEPPWQAIFSAPNYADLIKTRQTVKAREYRDKANSVLKASLIASINANDWPDAAAILRNGPAFANATGQLADSNERAAAIIDMITSPANPVAMFVLTAIPLVAQIFRNHETQLQEVPQARQQARRQRKAMREARKAEEPQFTIHLLRWKIPIRWHPKKIKIGKLFAGFRAQTLEPDALAKDVFTDPDVLKALEKLGIIVRARPHD
jgi:hypothetical protein